MAIPAGLGALFLKRRYGIPYVLNEGWTGYMEEDGSYKGWVIKWLTRRIVANASKILPVSQDLMRCMLGHGLAGAYTVVPNVIRTSVFLPKKAEQNEQIRFIHVSTFDPRQKNVQGILNAFRKALVKKPGMELLLVGSQELPEDLKKQIDLSHLQNQIQFLGSKSSEALCELFQKSTALIMFSHYESFGVVIGEALSCGLPVICSKAGGLSSLLSDQEAILVQTNNEEELCRAILHMAETYKQYDAESLRNFAESRFSESKVGDQLMDVYQDVLNKQPC